MDTPTAFPYIYLLSVINTASVTSGSVPVNFLGILALRLPQIVGLRRLFFSSGRLGRPLGHTDYLRACLQVSLAFKFVSDLVKVFGVLFSGPLLPKNNKSL